MERNAIAASLWYVHLKLCTNNCVLSFGYATATSDVELAEYCCWNFISSVAYPFAELVSHSVAYSKRRSLYGIPFETSIIPAISYSLTIINIRFILLDTVLYGAHIEPCQGTREYSKNTAVFFNWDERFRKLDCGEGTRPLIAHPSMFMRSPSKVLIYSHTYLHDKKNHKVT